MSLVESQYISFLTQKGPSDPEVALLRAIEQNDLEGVLRALREGADPRSMVNPAFNLLELAAGNVSVSSEVFEVILDTLEKDRLSEEEVSSLFRMILPSKAEISNLQNSNFDEMKRLLELAYLKYSALAKKYDINPLSKDSYDRSFPHAIMALEIAGFKQPSIFIEMLSSMDECEVASLREIIEKHPYLQEKLSAILTEALIKEDKGLVAKLVDISGEKFQADLMKDMPAMTVANNNPSIEFLEFLVEITEKVGATQDKFRFECAMDTIIGRLGDALAMELSERELEIAKLINQMRILTEISKALPPILDVIEYADRCPEMFEIVLETMSPEDCQKAIKKYAQKIGRNKSIKEIAYFRRILEKAATRSNFRITSEFMKKMCSSRSWPIFLDLIQHYNPNSQELFDTVHYLNIYGNQQEDREILEAIVDKLIERFGAVTLAQLSPNPVRFALINSSSLMAEIWYEKLSMESDEEIQALMSYYIDLKFFALLSSNNTEGSWGRSIIREFSREILDFQTYLAGQTDVVKQAPWLVSCKLAKIVRSYLTTIDTNKQEIESKNIAEKLKAGETVQIISGWKEHAVPILLFQHKGSYYISITNRGQGCYQEKKYKPFICRKINLEALSDEVLGITVQSQSKPFEEGKDLLYNQLLTQLEAEEDDVSRSLERSISPRKQTSGNCSVAGIKSNLRVMLELEYRTWLVENKENASGLGPHEIYKLFSLFTHKRLLCGFAERYTPERDDSYLAQTFKRPVEVETTKSYARGRKMARIARNLLGELEVAESILSKRGFFQLKQIVNAVSATV